MNQWSQQRLTLIDRIDLKDDKIKRQIQKGSTIHKMMDDLIKRQSNSIDNRYIRYFKVLFVFTSFIYYKLYNHIKLMESQPENCKTTPIKKLIFCNMALILYFLLPNISSFVLVIFLGSLWCAPCSSKCTRCKDQSQCSLNSCFSSYLEFSNSKKAMIVLGAALAAQVTYYLPTWLIVLIAVQIWAGWSFLVSLGIVEMVQTQVVSAESSLQKFLQMIPRYKGE